MDPKEVHKGNPASHFDDLIQQSSAVNLGMWVFLATEVLFFGGLFVVYIVYRVAYPQEFAEAGKLLNIHIGTINTAILLISSYFMALAVYQIQLDQVTKVVKHLCMTVLLGLVFLALKAYEYYDDFQKLLVPTVNVAIQGTHARVARLFYLIYYTMTGLHAFHLMIGIGLIGVIIVKTLRNEYSSRYFAPLMISGLYWHFIDLIWIFLYPLLYLMHGI